MDVLTAKLAPCSRSTVATND